MKKIFSVLLIFFILFSISGCISDTHRYTFPYDYTEVTSMTIYNIEDHINYYDISAVNQLFPLKIIDSKYYNEIMESIEEMKFEIVILLIAPAPSPKDTYFGYLLHVKYTNGVESLLCNGLRVDYYSSSDIHRQSYGTNEGFNQLMEKYL